LIGYDINGQAADSKNTLSIGNLIFGTGINGTGTTVSSGNLGIAEPNPETAIELTKTQPYFTFHNPTEEDIANGRESIQFHKGETGAGFEHVMAKITVAAEGGAGQEAYWALALNNGDDDDSPTERLRVDSKGLMTVEGAIASGYLEFSTEGPTDDVDVSGINVLFLSAIDNPITIGGFSGGVAGQTLRVTRCCKTANNVTLEHAEPEGTQKIYLHADADETLFTEYGGWILTCDGSDWFDVSHAKHT
jgi:hypothetical protein